MVATGDSVTSFGSGNQANPVTGTVLIPGGQSEAVLDVVVVVDNITENNIITCRVLADASPAASYAPGVDTEARVLICDGPYWSVQQLLPADYMNTMAVTPSALNAGIAGVGTWMASPQVVGMEGYDVSGGVQWKSALWRPTQGGTPLQNYGLSFVPKGISLPEISPAAPALLVGSSGTSAYRVFDNNSSGAILPHLPAGGAPSVASAVSPNKDWAVGFSTVNGRRRPVKWTTPDGVVASTDPQDLSSQFLDSSNFRVGEAFAVNNVGVVVGASTHFSGSTSISRPFRTQANAALLLDTDRLEAPGGVAGANGSGAATGVTHVPSGVSVGSWAAGYVFQGNNKKIGAYWTPGNSGLPTNPIRVSPLQRLGGNGQYTPDEECVVTGVSKKLVIVGWSAPTGVNPIRTAVLWRSGSWQDLNDKHFVGAIPSAWNLREAVSVSDSDVILAIGSAGGINTNAAFVLVPRVLSE